MQVRVELLFALIALIKFTTGLSFSKGSLGLKDNVLPSNEFLVPEGDLLFKHKFSIELSSASAKQNADMSKVDVLLDALGQFSCYYPYFLP